MHVCATLLKLPGFDALKKKTEFRKQETEWFKMEASKPGSWHGVVSAQKGGVRIR